MESEVSYLCACEFTIIPYPETDAGSPHPRPYNPSSKDHF